MWDGSVIGKDGSVLVWDESVIQIGKDGSVLM